MSQKLLNQETQAFLCSNVAGIKEMQKQLNKLSMQSSTNNNSDLQILYGRLYNQIQHFETDLSGKINNYISKKGKDNEQIAKKDVQFPKIEERFAKTTQSSGKFDNKKQAIKNQDYIQTFLRKKYELKKKEEKGDEEQQVQRNPHPAHPAHLLHPPPKILSKELRKNPFAAPPVITEQDLTTGLLSLITKGIIPKDVDLTPAFERGIPVVAKKPVTMHSNAEKKMIEINYHANAKAIAESKSVQQFVVDQRTFLTQQRKEEQIIEQPIQNKDISSIELEQNNKHKEPLNLKETITNYDFLIKLGQISVEQEGFLNCKRDYCYNWGAIQQLLTKLQEMARKRQLHHLEINGKALAKLGLDLKRADEDDLVNCLYNKVIIQKALKRQLIRSKRNQNEREQTAAERIQSFARMSTQIRRYRLQVQMKKNISVIQSRFKMVCNYQRTRKLIREKKESVQKEFQKRQEQFCSNWKWIKSHQRVEIHMNSLSFDEFQRLSLDGFSSKEKLQIPRLFLLKDPNVEIIYVTAQEVPADIKHYYTKVLELGGVEDYKSRVHFICPEYSSQFPGHFPVNKLLLYSHYALKQIETLIKNKPAYLVGGYPGQEDMYLCHYLNVPLLGGDPQKAYLSSTKAGARKLFDSCNIPIPPAITNLTKEDQFLQGFVDLIYEYPQIGTWVFKINDEIHGRGIASFPLDSIKMLHDLKKRRQSVPQDS